jgi:nucleoside-diphosphate-sugar epimerase
MAIACEPHIALVGGGYTLQRVAEILKPGEFVITSRNASTCEAWRAKGWYAHQVSLEDAASANGLFTAFPTIQRVVDSVPPLRAHADPAQGAKRLISAMKDRGIERVLYLSTTGVFGVRDGSEVTEGTPASPWNSQGEARWLSEQAYQKSGIPFTALRLPAIYGFDRGVVFSIRQGSYRLVRDGSLWTNRIHVDDLAQILVAALHGDSLPPVLCVADDRPAQAREVAEFVCAHEGLPLPECITEEEVLKSGGYTMLSNQRVRNDLMKRALRITLRYPSYREGLYKGAASNA